MLVLIKNLKALISKLSDGSVKKQLEHAVSSLEEKANGIIKDSSDPIITADNLDIRIDEVKKLLDSLKEKIDRLLPQDSQLSIKLKRFVALLNGESGIGILNKLVQQKYLPTDTHAIANQAETFPFAALPVELQEYAFNLFPQETLLKCREVSKQLCVDSKNTFDKIRKNIFLKNFPPRNPNFVGRKEQLLRIATMFKTSGERLYIIGPSGSGKSALAVEYVHQIANFFEYENVFWIPAASASQIEIEYIKLFNYFVSAPKPISKKIPQPEQTGNSHATDSKQINPVETKEINETTDNKERYTYTMDTCIEFVKSWLNSKKCLIVFDGVNDLSFVYKFFPGNKKGNILITVNADFPATLKTVATSELTIQESTTYIKKFLPNESESAIHQLAQRLGYLPLALELAVVDIMDRKVTIKDYLQLCDTKKVHLYSTKLLPPGSTCTPLRSLWDDILPILKDESHLAFTLLNLLAYFNTENIPIDFFEMKYRNLGQFIQIIDALGALSTFCILNNQSLNSLIQEVIRFKQTPEERVQNIATATKLLTETMADEADKIEDQIQVQRKMLLPHLQTLAGHIEEELEKTEDEIVKTTLQKNLAEVTNKITLFTSSQTDQLAKNIGLSFVSK